MTPVFLTKIKDTGYAKKLGEDDAHLKLFVNRLIPKEYRQLVSGLGNKMELTTNQKLSVLY
jgi:single-stranded-DNA-specific exonuclease